MIDTLMVLWTRGICGRFLRTLLVFLLLFTVICAMLFLVTASGVKWPGLAITVSSSGTSSPSATAQPTSTATPPTYQAPIILQNPTAIPAAPASTTPTPGAIHGINPRPSPTVTPSPTLVP